MPCLVWDSPQGRRVFDLDRSMMIVGRDEVADLQILEKSVSRRHALMQIENGSVKVTDLGSRSGTRINGAKLTPDLPSSVDPGDFVQLGRVTMTYHANPPPVKKPPPATKPPAARPATARRPAPAPAAPGDRWKLVAIISAFVAVAGLGAIIALLATRDDEPSPQPQVIAPVVEEDPPAPTAEPQPDPPAEEVVEAAPPKVEENRAPDGEMPPRGFLSLRDYPDLLEFNYTEYYPIRLITWNETRVKAVGGDGRTYSIPRAKVTKSENRVDLARRAARTRAQLDPDDAAAHLDLARWCAQRYIRTETRALSKRVLELRPDDPEATQLLRSTE